MAISDLLNRRVRAQPKNEDDEVYSEASASASASASEVERNDEGSDQDSDGEDDDEGLSADIVSHLSRQHWNISINQQPEGCPGKRR